jgi:hypothetical protein
METGYVHLYTGDGKGRDRALWIFANELSPALTIVPVK